jgi:hypothetical protein
MSNSLVADFRSRFPDDPRSDAELTLAFGQAHDQDQRYSQFPDFVQDYQALKQTRREAFAPPLTEEIRRGLASGVEGTAATIASAGALASDAIGKYGKYGLPGLNTLYSLLPESAHKAVRNYLLDKAQKFEDAAAENAPTIPTVRDIKSPADAVRYAAYGAGQVVPSLVEAGVTAGAGSLIGAGAGTVAEPGGGTAVGAVGGGIAGFFEKQAVKSLIKKGIQNFSREQLATEAKALGMRYGQHIATALNSYALSSGEIYNDLATDKSVDPDKALNVSLLGGLAAAWPDTLLPSYVASKFIRGVEGKAVGEAAKKGFYGYLTRFVSDAAKEVPMEAGTESFQEWVDIAAKRYATGKPITAPLSQEEKDRITNAGVFGGIGGLIAAPVSAIPGHGNHDVLNSYTGNHTPEIQTQLDDLAKKAADGDLTAQATVSQLPPEQRNTVILAQQDLERAKTAQSPDIEEALGINQPEEVSQNGEEEKGQQEVLNDLSVPGPAVQDNKTGTAVQTPVETATQNPPGSTPQSPGDRLAAAEQDRLQRARQQMSNVEETPAIPQPQPVVENPAPVQQTPENAPEAPAVNAPRETPAVAPEAPVPTPPKIVERSKSSDAKTQANAAFDRVNNMSGKDLTAEIKRLGLTKQFEHTPILGENASQAEKELTLSEQRIRIKAIAAIVNKTFTAADNVPEHSGLITPEMVDYDVEQPTHGEPLEHGFFSIPADEQTTPETFEKLVSGARGPRKDAEGNPVPVQKSRRLVSILDNSTGKVYLASAFKDKVVRVTDPAKVSGEVKEKGGGVSSSLADVMSRTLEDGSPRYKLMDSVRLNFLKKFALQEYSTEAQYKEHFGSKVEQIAGPPLAADVNTQPKGKNEQPTHHLETGDELEHFNEPASEVTPFDEMVQKEEGGRPSASSFTESHANSLYQVFGIGRLTPKRFEVLFEQRAKKKREAIEALSVPTRELMRLGVEDPMEAWQIVKRLIYESLSDNSQSKKGSLESLQKSFSSQAIRRIAEGHGQVRDQTATASQGENARGNGAAHSTAQAAEGQGSQATEGATNGRRGDTGTNARFSIPTGTDPTIEAVRLAGEKDPNVLSHIHRSRGLNAVLDTLPASQVLATIKRLGHDLVAKFKSTAHYIEIDGVPKDPAEYDVRGNETFAQWRKRNDLRFDDLDIRERVLNDNTGAMDTKGRDFENQILNEAGYETHYDEVRKIQSRLSLPAGDPHLRELAAPAFQSVRIAIQRAGIPVTIHQQVTGSLVKAFLRSGNVTGEVEGGMYDRAARAVQVVLRDIQNPSQLDLRTLFDEAGHALFDRESPGRQQTILQSISQALDSAIGLSEQGARDIASAQPGASTGVLAEERLARAVADRLQKNGFNPTEAQGIGQRILRFIKDFYYRSLMVLQKALLGDQHNSPKLITKYFQNRLESFLSGQDMQRGFIRQLVGEVPSKSTVGSWLGAVERMGENGIEHDALPWTR